MAKKLSIREKRLAVLKATGVKPPSKEEIEEIARGLQAQPGHEEDMREADAAFEAFKRDRAGADGVRRRRRA